DKVRRPCRLGRRVDHTEKRDKISRVSVSLDCRQGVYEPRSSAAHKNVERSSAPEKRLRTNEPKQRVLRSKHLQCSIENIVQVDDTALHLRTDLRRTFQPAADHRGIDTEKSRNFGVAAERTSKPDE